mgnify:CR=1 FL=1
MSDERTTELLTRFARLIAADGYEYGLKPVQWQALRYLASANRFSRTPKGLTAWLGQTKGSVSQTISALEKKQLVERRSDAVDGRVVRLALTVKANALLASSPPMAAQMLSHLSERERSWLEQLIENMLRSQLATADQQPFGQCRNCRHFKHGGGGKEGHFCTLLEVRLSDAHSQQICIEQEAA